MNPLSSIELFVHKHIEPIVGRLCCAFGSHSYLWKLKKGERISLKGNPPGHAKCKYCKKVYGDK